MGDSDFEDSRYRGRDRRAKSGTHMLGPDTWMRASVALLVGFAVIQVVVARIVPAPAGAGLASLQRVDTAAGALLVVAGVEMLLRWHLDGRAFAWWVGLALIVLGVPGLAGSGLANSALALAATSVAALLLLAGLRTPEVDATLSIRRTLIALLGGMMSMFAVSVALAALLRDFRLAAGVLTLVLISLAVAYGRSVRGERWLVLTLAGCALAQTFWIFVPAGALQLADATFMHLVTGVTAVVGAALGLQMSARTHRTVALEARQQREVVEARYSETLHEVRSTVVALEGGMRTLRPQSPSDESSQQVLAHTLVAELRRLRELVEPGQIATHGEFSVREALEPLLTVSSAGGWPVSWSIPEDLRARGQRRGCRADRALVADERAALAPGSPIDVTATTEDDFVVLRVDDRGPGVAHGRRELIFERGERSDRGEHPDAKGLGLHIARRLARELDGELWVEPRPDSGARFVLIVPTASVHVRVDRLEHPRRAS